MPESNDPNSGSVAYGASSSLRFPGAARDAGARRAQNARYCERTCARASGVGGCVDPSIVGELESSATLGDCASAACPPPAHPAMAAATAAIATALRDLLMGAPARGERPRPTGWTATDTST